MTFRASPADGVAWITGASSGIGRSVALELARCGWRVAASARRLEELEALAAEASRLEGKVIPRPVDVTDATAMAACVETIEREDGPIALAFLNAGIAPYMRAGNLDPDAFRRTYDVNVFGIVHALAPLLPQMMQRGRGQVALNASIAGWRGLPRAAAYASSKAAVINLAECLKFDLDRSGVTIQVVCPGFVETPLTAKNDFRMPFLIPQDEAARRVCDGFARGGFMIAFPRRFSAIVRALNWLPRSHYFSLVGKMTAGRKRG
jgi:NAD(P)-dependent dehydrogenase (short-subunit alcohol dehydrogenase family)